MKPGFACTNHAFCKTVQNKILAVSLGQVREKRAFSGRLSYSYNS